MDLIDREELSKFVLDNDIKEDFNYDAEYMYRYVKDGKLVGVVVYMLQDDVSGNKYPRIIHVILDTSIRRRKEAYKFIINTFRDLKEKGYKVVIAIVPRWKMFMIALAEKLTFKMFAEDENNYYYFMNINDLVK